MSSTCVDLPSATFVCLCRPNFTGLLCDEEIDKRDYDLPSFDGRSFVRMNRLKAYHTFSIEVEFKTYAENGIILYNQQKSDGSGDFVSLAIVDGCVRRRWSRDLTLSIIHSLHLSFLQFLDTYSSNTTSAMVRWSWPRPRKQRWKRFTKSLRNGTAKMEFWYSTTAKTSPDRAKECSNPWIWTRTLTSGTCRQITRSN